MNEVMKALLDRRSIRQYEDKAVPAELIEQIVEAGLHAPSSMGKQNSKIVVITNKELIHELSVVNNEIGGWPEGNDPVYGAPVVLLVLGYNGMGKQKYDGSVIMENLMLAAHSLGLGSCWIHRAKEQMETPVGKKILDTLGLSADEWEGIGNCIIGYPKGEAPKAAARKEDRVYHID